jgi:hypothetical protein
MAIKRIALLPATEVIAVAAGVVVVIAGLYGVHRVFLVCMDTSKRRIGMLDS